MANIDFDTKPLIAPNDSKIFGTVDTAVDFAETLGKDISLKRALCTLQRGPVRFYRDNVIVCDENEDAADYLFLSSAELFAVANLSKMVTAMLSLFIFPAICSAGPT